jgi:hypothetical protein
MTWVCPSVDTDRFKARCRLPLLGRQWNVWRMVASGKLAGRSPEELEQIALQIFRMWMHEANPGLDDPLSACTSLVIHPTPPPVELVPLGSSNDQARRACFEEGMIAVRSVQGAPTPEVWVSFVYEGPAKEMPWPVTRANEFLIVDWCPVDADWIVAESFTFHERKGGGGGDEPSPEPEPFKIIPDMPDAVNPSRSFTGVLFWGAAGLFGAYIMANRLFGSD